MIPNERPMKVLIDAVTLALLIDATPGCEVASIVKTYINQEYVISAKIAGGEFSIHSTQEWTDLRNRLNTLQLETENTQDARPSAPGTDLDRELPG